jgi:hypothetical protein
VCEVIQHDERLSLSLALIAFVFVFSSCFGHTLKARSNSCSCSRPVSNVIFSITGLRDLLLYSLAGPGVRTNPTFEGLDGRAPKRSTGSDLAFNSEKPAG